MRRRAGEKGTKRGGGAERNRFKGCPARVRRRGGNKGVPTVRYCASELFLSANYFGDVIRQSIGQSPKDYIRQYVIDKAKNMLLSGMNVSQTADELGFEYPQHFTRLFKRATGKTLRNFYRKRKIRKFDRF